jgi:hypothetical protein
MVMRLNVGSGLEKIDHPLDEIVLMSVNRQKHATARALA